MRHIAARFAKTTLPAVPSPKLEPWVVSIHGVMLLVRGLPIGRLERPFVRQSKDMLQQFYFGNGLLNIHIHAVSRYDADQSNFGVHGHRKMHLQLLKS
jgi:hypothetical protein